MTTPTAAPLSAEQLDRDAVMELMGKSDMLSQIGYRALMDGDTMLADLNFLTKLVNVALIAQARAAEKAEPECGWCNDSGVVGFPPDQYESCPHCTAPQATASPAPRVSGQDERALFEAHAVNSSIWLPEDLVRNGAEYTRRTIEREWLAWQARAAIASSPSRGEAPAAQGVEVREAILTGAHAEFSESLPPGSLTSTGHRHVFNALRAAIKFYIGHAAPAASVALAEDALERSLTDHRIAVIPESEGGWHAHVYLDQDVSMASGYGETPRAAIDAAMSSTQHSAKAGGDK